MYFDIGMSNHIILHLWLGFILMFVSVLLYATKVGNTGTTVSKFSARGQSVKHNFYIAKKISEIMGTSCLQNIFL